MTIEEAVKQYAVACSNVEKAGSATATLGAAHHAARAVYNQACDALDVAKKRLLEAASRDGNSAD